MKQGIFLTTFGLAIAATAIAATAHPNAAPSQQQPTPLPSVVPTGMPSPSATSTGMTYYPQTPPSIGPSTGPTGVPSPQAPSPSPGVPTL